MKISMLLKAQDFEDLGALGEVFPKTQKKKMRNVFLFFLSFFYPAYPLGAMYI